MSRRLSLCVFSLVVTCVSVFAVPLSAQAPRTIRLMGNDSLHYSFSTITAKPGERVTIEMRTMSMQSAEQMSHNFVMLKPGSNIDQFVAAAAKDKLHGFMPPALKAQVLVATDMVAAGDVAKVTFAVPAKPGTYTFFCSFPGHYSGGMKGTLIVK